MLRNNLCTLGCRSNLSCVTRCHASHVTENGKNADRLEMPGRVFFAQAHHTCVYADCRLWTHSSVSLPRRCGLVYRMNCNKIIPNYIRFYIGLFIHKISFCAAVPWTSTTIKRRRFAITVTIFSFQQNYLPVHFIALPQTIHEIFFPHFDDCVMET